MATQAPTQLWLTKGATVSNAGREYMIVALADLNMVIAKDIESGERVLLKIGDLGAPKLIQEVTAPKSKIDLLDVSDTDWGVAESRRQSIEPLLRSPFLHAKAQSKEIALRAGVSPATGGFKHEVRDG